MKKVSIIVPVYNGEKYIKRCVDSLVSQLYENKEIIVINDGSTDNTSRILDEYKNEIIVIDKENSGVSNTRNKGLDVAYGDYICFCDADDWLEQNAIEIMMKEISDCDALRFGHNVVEKSKKTKKLNSDDALAEINNIYTDDTVLKYLIENKTMGHITNYLFKKNIINENNIRFDSKIFYQEDVIFLIEYIACCKKIKVIDNPLYNYFINYESVTNDHKSSVKNMCDIHNIRSTILEKMSKYGVLQYKKLLEQKFLNLQLMYFLDYYNNLSKKEFASNLKQISNCNQVYYNDIIKQNIGFKWKVFIFLLMKGYIRTLGLYISIYNKIR